MSMSMCLCVYVYVYMSMCICLYGHISGKGTTYYTVTCMQEASSFSGMCTCLCVYVYGVAAISRLLTIIGLFCRISSLL